MNEPTYIELSAPRNASAFKKNCSRQAISKKWRIILVSQAFILSSITSCSPCHQIEKQRIDRIHLGMGRNEIEKIASAGYPYEEDSENGRSYICYSKHKNKDCNCTVTFYFNKSGRCDGISHEHGNRIITSIKDPSIREDDAEIPE